MHEILLLLASGLFGGVLGYWFSVFKRSQETKARKAILLQLLRNELKSIGGALEPYNVAKAFYRDPLRLGTPERLLDAETLQYDKDDALVELLLHLQVAVARHNDFVSLTNHAQAVISVPDNVHAQWYSDLQQRNGAVVAVRDALLNELENRA